MAINISDASAILMVTFTFLATIINILLWLTTRRTVVALAVQVKHQIASGHVLALQNMFDAHRELFLNLINHPDLLERFTMVNSLDAENWQLEKISAFMINQIFMGFLNIEEDIINESYLAGFKRDARDVFSYSSVREHWKYVRVFHPQTFREFVESELLYPEVD